MPHMRWNRAVFVKVTSWLDYDVSLRLSLPLRSFRWLWATITVGHALCAAALWILTMYFWYLGKPEMEYYALFLNPTRPNLQAYATPLGLLALLHTNAVIGAIALTKQAGKPTFAPLTWLWTMLRHLWAILVSKHIFKLTGTVHESSGVINRSVGSRRWQSAKQAVVRVNRFHKLVFGVGSSHFSAIQMVREAIEVGVQMTQAYRASFLVSSSSINHLLVAVLVLNSWSTPFIQNVFGMNRRQSDHRKALSRVLCLLVSASLNGMSCMAVPILLLIPFWRDFDFDVGDLPVALEYNDVYFSREVTESQMIATGTLTGLLFMLLPHLSIWLCFDLISRIAEFRPNKCPLAHSIDVDNCGSCRSSGRTNG